MSEQPHKAIGWFEVYSPNKAKMLDFYTSIFGFTTSDMDMGEMGTYTMLHHNGVPLGGTMEMTSPEWDGIPPHWMTYFMTLDINGTIEKIKANGGEVKHGPMDIPGNGKIAVCADDQGAYFSIVQEGSDQEKTPMTEAIDWVEHMSPDREKANAFYKNVFGWDVMEQDMGPEVGMYTMFHVGESFHAGAMTFPQEGGFPNWMVYLVTNDINSSVDQIKTKGGTILADVMEVPEVGHIAIAQDCCGAAFGLHQPVKR